MREDDLIKAFARMTPRRSKDVLLGIGDDAAVLKASPNKKWVVTTDALIEDVHFKQQWLSPAELGRRAALVNLSDIAAMGAQPVAGFSALTIPAHVSVKDIKAFSQALASEFKRHGAILAGGNLSRGPVWSITITLIGKASRVIYRSGAKPGDGLYVSGPLGAASIGLAALERGVRSGPFVKAWRAPASRMALGLKLAKMTGTHAMMDISDGLWLDLERLMRASGMQAELELKQIPRPSKFAAACEQFSLDGETLALTGGEDYELLIAMSGKSAKAAEKLGLIRIGTVITKCKNQPLVTVHDERGLPVKIKRHGYEHFSLKITTPSQL